MPNMSGIDFIQELKKSQPNIPVIFCSAFAGRDEMVQFIDLGAYGFIDKPFEEDKLTLMITNAIKIKKLRDGIIKLSGLNFNAFIGMTNALQQMESNQLDAAKISKEKLQKKLNEISELTNALMKQGR
jgi:two-component system nitrogen regulation response regulator NtrX